MVIHTAVQSEEFALLNFTLANNSSRSCRRGPANHASWPELPIGGRIQPDNRNRFDWRPCAWSEVRAHMSGFQMCQIPNRPKEADRKP